MELMPYFVCNANHLTRLRKFYTLQDALKWTAHETLGFLCTFFGAAVELAEDGNISDWTAVYLHKLTQPTSGKPEEIWNLLRVNQWIEHTPEDKILIKDWLDYAAPYLEEKYDSSDPRDMERLKNIWSLHRRIYRRFSKKGALVGTPPASEDYPAREAIRESIEERLSGKNGVRERPLDPYHVKAG